MSREPLWRQVGRQTLWGKRGPAKTGTLWLPLATVLALGPADQMPGAWRAGIVLFAASVLRTVGTILANDLTDRAEDTAAGKRRWIAQLPWATGTGVVVGVLALGFALLLLGGGNATALAAYGSAMALGLVYSLPPLRLKGRGLVGMLAYGACCACAYAVLPAAWFRATWQVLALTTAVVFCDRWVNLHFHQILDCEADASRGCRTFVVRLGPGSARRLLSPAALVASATFLALLGVLASASSPVGSAAVLATCAASLAAAWHARASRRGDSGTPLAHELPAFYLGLAYGVFWVLPPMILGVLALQSASVLVLAVLAAFSSLLTTLNVIRYRHD